MTTTNTEALELLRLLQSLYECDLKETSPEWAQRLRDVIAKMEATPAPTQPDVLDALRIFVGCATPVSTDINPRGYAWSEAYLDSALPIARAAMAKLTQPDSPKLARPQNCGTGYCSCIECPFGMPKPTKHPTPSGHIAHPESSDASY